MHPAIEVLGSHRAVLHADEERPLASQVQEYLQRIGDPRAIERVALTTKPLAPLLIPAIEAMRRLPTLILYGYGEEARVLGELDLDEYRHRAVRPRRAQLAHGERLPRPTILDGAGRGLSASQREEIAAALGCAAVDLLTCDVSMGHVDLSCPEREMVERLFALDLSIEEWTSGRIVYIPPGNGIVAAIMATTIYGLAESWPKIVRFGRRDDAFHVAEVIDLQAMYEWGHQYAAELERDGAPVAVPRPLFNRTLAAITDDVLRVELKALIR